MITDTTCPLVTAVEMSVKARPHAIAVSGAAGSSTYAELWEAIQDWAHRLRALDPPRRSVVAIQSTGASDLPAVFLGTRAAGLVPLLIDALTPRNRQIAMIKAARPSLVIDMGAERILPGLAPDARTLPDRAGYLIFSSGSQGKPKGIIGNIDGLIRFLDWEREYLQLEASCRVAMLTSPSFDVVLREFLLPLTIGGRLQAADVAVRTAPDRVLPWLADCAAEVVHLVPSLMGRWLAADVPRLLPALGWTLFAGEPLFDTHVTAWRAVAPNSRILNLYGPSETTLAKFSYEISNPCPAGLQPVGTPLPGTRLQQLPIDGDASMAAFRVGIETPDGSLGYLEDVPEADRCNLVRSEGITSFLTQDRGRLLNGDLYIDGRLDSAVKRRGVLVDLAPIEAAALRHPRITEACCVHITSGMSSDIVLVVETTEDMTRTEVSHHLRTSTESLPDEVVLITKMPLLPSGKIDRRSVAALVQFR